MGKYSKNKGSGYELKTAKFMSAWWGGNFSRVPASGGLHWKGDQRVAGDIIPPIGLDFPFVIECKKREEWSMEHILLDIGQPKEWWSQVVTDGRRVDRTPLLIFSRNRAKDFVMIPYQSYIYGKIKDISHEHFRTNVTIKNIRDEVQSFDVIVTTLDTFAKVPIVDLVEYGKTVAWDNYADQYREEV